MSDDDGWWIVKRDGTDPPEFLTNAGEWSVLCGATAYFGTEADADAARRPDGTSGTPTHVRGAPPRD